MSFRILLTHTAAIVAVVAAASFGHLAPHEFFEALVELAIASGVAEWRESAAEP